MVTKCSCPGAVCVCGAEGVVKDGASVRTSAMMMDSATGAPISITDRAASSKYDNVRGISVGGTDAATYYATLDAADEAPKAQRALARRDAAQESYEASLGDAWKGASSSKTRMADSVTVGAKAVEDRVYRDCIAQGLSDVDARSKASYDAWRYRTENAHKAA